MYLYREGELPDEIRRQVQQHVGSCQTCAEELQQIRSTAIAVADFRRAEPQVPAKRDLTEQIMRAIEPVRASEARPQRAAMPFRRLQFSCTLAAALVVAAFFIQNTLDVYRMAALESRLTQFSSVIMTHSGDPPLAAVGLNAIAEIGRMLSEPPAMNSIGLHERLQLREAARTFLAVLEEGPPGFSGEVQRLRAKYPELWSISPFNGLTAHDRLLLAGQGKALMSDLRTLLQPGKSDYEK